MKVATNRMRAIPLKPLGYVFGSTLESVECYRNHAQHKVLPKLEQFPVRSTFQKFDRMCNLCYTDNNVVTGIWGRCLKASSATEF